MKWTVVSKSAKQEIYQLRQEDKIVLTLEFHPFTSAARIETADEKRVFQIRREGFLRNKTVLRNEYGIRIGQLDHVKSNDTEGEFELNEEKFSYTISNEPSPELFLYRENTTVPFVVCGLKENNGNTSFHFSEKNIFSPLQHFLLMSLCWYTFLPVTNTNRVEVFAS